MKFYNKLKQFIVRQDGAFVVFFALIVPALLGIGALAVDGANLINHRARLAEATNEAVLAISAIHNKNATADAISTNRTLVRNYMFTYLEAYNEGHVDSGTINVEYNNDEASPEYYVTATYQPTLFLAQFFLQNKQDRIFTVSNWDNHSGNARKSDLATSIDVTFIVDASSSITCARNRPDCNSWSEIGNQTTRLDQLKGVINKVVGDYLDQKKVHFAFVPFDIGVPFRPQDAVTDLRNQRQKNELDGERVGCSIAYTLKAPFKDIDFAFWANKYIDYKDTPIYQSIYDNRIFFAMDYYRYRYYLDVVAKARNWDIEQLVSRGWCKDNGHISRVTFGEHRYSCESDPRQSIFTTNNRRIIRQQYNNMAALMKTLYDDMDAGRYSIANMQTIDIPATLNNMFRQDSVIEFYQPTAPHLLTQRNFSLMCQSAQTGKNALISATDITLDADALYAKAAENIVPDRSAAKTFLIPMTASRADKIRLMDSLAAMAPGGGTDTMSGFLRALPIVAQGSGENKIIVIITDGRDDTAGARDVRNAIHQAGICQRVITGLKNGNVVPHPASAVSIHYISLNPSATDGFGSWQTHCADGENIFTYAVDNAPDLEQLITSFISQAETGFFINDPKHKNARN